MSKMIMVFVGLALAACSVETEQAPEPATKTVSSELLQDPLVCYGKCVDRGGSPANCDSSCQCNGSCNPGGGSAFEESAN